MAHTCPYCRKVCLCEDGEEAILACAHFESPACEENEEDRDIAVEDASAYEEEE